jgi:hypothetical protein
LTPGRSTAARCRLTPATTFLPPMIPRDLGLALVPIVLWLVVRRPRAGRSGGGASVPPAVWCS